MNRFGLSSAKEKALQARMDSLGIREEDLEESFVRSSGPGGQKTNKTATCVRLRHAPSGVELKIQRARTQALNRFYARRILCERLEERLLGQEAPSQKAVEKKRKQKDRRRRRRKKDTDQEGTGAEDS